MGDGDDSPEVQPPLNEDSCIIESRERELDRARLAAIVEGSHDAIISKTLDGHVTSWNAGAMRMFGYREEEMIGQSITRIIPPELHGEEEQILAQLRRGERVEPFDTVRVTKDGHRIAISLTVSPLRDRSGRVIGVSKIARDITERKKAEELRNLLLIELNHRVKNTLANVEAILRSTMRQSNSFEDFAESFSGRIRALANAHSMLTETAWQGADLRELIHDQLFIGVIDEAKVVISGSPVRLSAQTTTHLALMLHELATNSAKHGALSVPGGRLSIEWVLIGRRLCLKWRERGGPKVNRPSRRGFGLTLIEQTAKTEGGDARLSWEADGIVWELELPI